MKIFSGFKKPSLFMQVAIFGLVFLASIMAYPAEAAPVTIKNIDGKSFKYDTISPVRVNLQTGASSYQEDNFINFEFSMPLNSFNKDVLKSNVLIGINSEKEIILVSTNITKNSIIQKQLNEMISSKIINIDIEIETKGDKLYRNVVEGTISRVVLEDDTAFVLVKPVGKSYNNDFMKIISELKGEEPINQNSTSPMNEMLDSDKGIAIKENSDTPNQKIPNWIKTNIKWYGEGKITENDFLMAIEWLINNGIIVIEKASIKPLN